MKEIKIITLGDIFDNIETEEKAFKFIDYIKDLQQKVEQLENIRKEAIKYVQEKADYPISYYHCLNDLLNILNKGSDKEYDRLGYEYKSLLEQVVYALHHIPYTKDFISEERLKKLEDLSLKLSTGDCEIIEFKRTLCKYNFTDILKEKDDEIDRLNNKIEQLRTELKKKNNGIGRIKGE